MISENSGLKIDQFRSILTTEKFGREIQQYGNVGSTSDIARESAEQGAPEGTLIIAGSQEQGRGRHRRQWFSPEGGLWFSLILRPETKNLQALPLLMGASMARVIEEFTGLDAKFQWPNDVFIHERKVGGILLESRFSGEKPVYIIAGFGVNVNFHTSDLGENLAVMTTSLLDELGKEISLDRFLAAVLARLEEDYADFLKNGPSPLIEKYKNRCLTIGKRVRVIEKNSDEFSGEAVDITPDGGLEVVTDGGEKKILYDVERLSLEK
jgi:BirA family transcriptional regulator, biotin operon repressor / biotin---[acetyl-CoA-carboxylase] ligase